MTKLVIEKTDFIFEMTLQAQNVKAFYAAMSLIQKQITFAKIKCEFSMSLKIEEKKRDGTRQITRISKILQIIADITSVYPV